MIVLDTDLISILQRAESPQRSLLISRIEQAQQIDRVSATVITYEEQIRGWMRALSAAKSLQEQIPVYRRLSLHAAYFSGHPLLDFDENSAVEFQRLKQHKVRIGTMDLKIAAIVLANRAELWTRNLGDFDQVPGLSVSDPLAK